MAEVHAFICDVCGKRQEVSEFNEWHRIHQFYLGGGYKGCENCWNEAIEWMRNRADSRRQGFID